MLKRSVVFIILFCLMLTPKVQAQGQGIIKECFDRFRSISMEREIILIEIKSGGAVKKKQLKRWTEFKGDQERVSIEFLAPETEKGTRLRIDRSPGKKDLIRIKKRSMIKRTISGERKSLSFAGTDFTYQDTCQMMGERISNYEYKVIGENQRRWLIEALPKDPEEAFYEKRVFHILKEGYVIGQVSYYQEGQLTKEQFNLKQVVADDGSAWRVGEIVMKNYLVGSSTRLKIIERRIEPFDTTAVFGKKFLE